MSRGMIGLLVALILLIGAPSAQVGPNQKVRQGLQRLQPLLAEADVHAGDPLFVRIFKQEAELELWFQSSTDKTYQLFKTYPICAFSGELGPKTREGDGQAPEGFYQVGSGQLNPYSSYHLSFNLGYPNAYERARGWTGSYLMVHGSCVSIGCYAMTDDGIEEIYALVEAALKAGQSKVPVHVFPFRFGRAHEALIEASPHREFWRQLEAGYLAFEEQRVPPTVRVRSGQYQVD